MLQNKISANKKKISLAYLTTEMSPILNSIGFGEYIQNLVKYALKSSFDVKVFAPKFGEISGRKNRLHQIARLSGLHVSVGDSVHELLVKSTSLNDVKIQIYLLDGAIDFPMNATMLDDNGDMDPEADMKAVFFCKSALETMHLLGWSPSIIHCHGWMSMFTSRLIKDEYNDIDLFANSKVISSVYNDQFEKRFVNKTKLAMPAHSGYSEIVNSAISLSDHTILAEEGLSIDLNSTGANISKIDISSGEDGFTQIIDIYNSLQ